MTTGAGAMVQSVKSSINNLLRHSQRNMTLLTNQISSATVSKLSFGEYNRPLVVATEKTLSTDNIRV